MPKCFTRTGKIKEPLWVILDAIVNKPEDKIHSVLLLPENPLRKAEGGLRTQGYFKLNQKDKPLISAITVVFNGAEFLVQTIKSVINQSYDNVEYIIIDGGSTDGTINIIKEYEHKIDYWISEPDRGISDAMNKGINLSKGDCLIFLNSDDYFMSDGALEKAVSFLKNKRHIYVFKVLFDDGEIKSVSTNKAFNFLMNFKMGSCHQGHICSRSLFEKIGLFDSRFKITMDYDFMLRAYYLHKRATDSIEIVIYGASKPASPPDFKYPIHYLGQINDDISLSLLYSAVDVMIVPSREDNLPNTVVESVACEPPVVAFNIGGMPDMIQHLNPSSWLFLTHFL